MPPAPTGTATFLFTDIEGSTKLLQRLGDAFRPLLERHHRLLRDAFDRHGGYVPRTEGDAFFVVFGSAVHAVAAAAEAQRALAAEPWPEDAAVRVRMGLHTGEAVLGADDYVGLDVHRAARIAAAAHGGQVLLSATTRALVADALPEGASLLDLGEHRLKDLERPERLFQLQIAGIRAEFPPPRALDGGTARLPAPLTSFVGREAELAEGRRLLASTRLLTLTGPGGTGKTRLGLALAAAEAGRFADGACFVALASITEPELVPSEIISALGEPDTGAKPPRERLLEAVRDQQLLLVLDNFEQVLGAAPVVADLLKAGPRVSVVATSRSALRVSGERELPVPPLGLPDPRALPGSLEALGQFEAVRLFVDRAMAVQPEFRVTNANAPAVAGICVRLDGLPLAIELAAARVKLLPPEALLRRLEKRLPLLGGGARDLPARQQTLRGAIAWSHDLLDDPSRRLFARCAVFSGGTDIESAEAVCGPAEELGIDVLDGLSLLVDHSLVRQSEVEGEPRFWMLETIREFAAEQLEASDEADAIRLRQAEHFLELAERAAPHLTGADQITWLGQLEREHDNFRAAHGWCVAAGRGEPGLRLCAALWRFWHMRGHLVEGRQRVAQVLALAGVADYPYPLMKAEEAAGGLAYWQGDPAMLGHYERALDLARQIGDPTELANALYNLAFPFMEPGPDGTPPPRVGRAVELLREAEGLCRDIADPALMGRVLWGLANASFWMRDYPSTQRYAEAALDVFRRGGSVFDIAWALHMIGVAAAKQGQLDLGARRAAEALALFAEARDLSGIALGLLDMAEVAFLAGDRDRAIRIAGAFTAISTAGGIRLLDINLASGWVSLADHLEGWRSTAAWGEGAALTPEQAAAYALAGAAVADLSHSARPSRAGEGAPKSLA